MATCQNCDYEWTYNGNMDMTTCPNCQNKTQIHTKPEAIEAGHEIESRINTLKDQLSEEGDYLHLYMVMPDSYPGQVSVKAEVSDNEEPRGIENGLHVRTEPLTGVDQ